MKQKNLVLMVVAVGCGLVAAFLTSMMASGPKKEETVDILVAAKELKPGDKFTKDSLKDQVKRKAVPKTLIPQNAASTEDDLIEKQLIKGLREGDHISVTDTGVWEPLKPPSGHDSITIRLSVEQMTPFVKSTSHVNLFGTVKNRRTGEVKGMVLIPDLLVMAIDADVNPGGRDTGAMNKQVVTLAATPDECELIRVAQDANVNMSFILLNPDNISSAAKKSWTLEGTRKWINESIVGKEPTQVTGGETTAPPAEKKLPETAPAPTKALVKYLVPKDNLNPGTALTADIITDKFTTKEAETLPDGALTDLKPYLGKYVVKQMWKDVHVTQAAIGENPNPTTAAAPATTEKPVEKRKFTESEKRVWNGTTVRVFVIRLYEGDEKPVVIGEKVDGRVVPVAGGAGEPDSKPAEPKQEKSVDEKKVSLK